MKKLGYTFTIEVLQLSSYTPLQEVSFHPPSSISPFLEGQDAASGLYNLNPTCCHSETPDVLL